MALLVLLQQGSGYSLQRDGLVGSTRVSSTGRQEQLDYKLIGRYWILLAARRKEALWPYIREFADNALTHVCKTLSKLTACGETCELYDIHGHYADAGEAAALMSYTLGVDMVLTGHSLGRNKLDHLLKSGEAH
jgi:hypothetical protein